MKQGGHTPSEPGRAAGRDHSTRDAGRQSLRPYGAITRAFNAVRNHAFYSPLHKEPPSLQTGRGGRHENSLVSRERGEGRGEGHRAATRRFLALLVLCLGLVAPPAMARVPVILDFGDSLTAGYGVPAGQALTGCKAVAKTGCKA